MKEDDSVREEKPAFDTRPAPVTDNLNILTAGKRGPALPQDLWLIEKMAHLTGRSSRTPHDAKAGAHGTFTVTHDMTRYTKASLPRSAATPMTPASTAASAVRRTRARHTRLALKFYTEEGNDMVATTPPCSFS
jgi:catalase